MKFIRKIIFNILKSYNLRFTDKQIKIVSMIFGLLIIIGLVFGKFNLAFVLVFTYTILLTFMNHRNAKYEYYAISCTIQATDYGDTIILNILAIYNDLIVSYLPQCYMPRYYLKQDETYNLIHKKIHKLRQIDDNLIVFDNLYNTFDEAACEIYNLKADISRIVSHNIIRLRSKEEKISFNTRKASKFFAFFRK